MGINTEFNNYLNLNKKKVFKTLANDGNNDQWTFQQ